MVNVPQISTSLTSVAGRIACMMVSPAILASVRVAVDASVDPDVAIVTMVAGDPSVGFADSTKVTE